MNKNQSKGNQPQNALDFKVDCEIQVSNWKYYTKNGQLELSIAFGGSRTELEEMRKKFSIENNNPIANLNSKMVNSQPRQKRIQKNWSEIQYQHENIGKTMKNVALVDQLENKHKKESSAVTLTLELSGRQNVSKISFNLKEMNQKKVVEETTIKRDTASIAILLATCALVLGFIVPI